MSQFLTLQLSDDAYNTLEMRAKTIGIAPPDLAAVLLERECAGSRAHSNGEEGRDRFERQFGSVDLQRATGSDNEGIDEDLAREYADSHERA